MSDRNKARVGRKEENKVVKCLRKLEYEVRHISKRTDSNHYDLEYKKPNEDSWRFLEVKKDSGGFFFLSKAEKETAMRPENMGRYDIAIVMDKVVHIIEQPFDFKDETFEMNSKFFATPTEYKINFQLGEHNA